MRIEDARNLHKDALVIDLHTDSLIASKVLRYDLSKRHKPPKGLRPWRLHADIPRLKEGGVDCAFLVIVTFPYFGSPFSRALESIEFARSFIEKNKEIAALALKPGDIVHSKEKGRIAFGLGLEGLHALDGRLDNLEELFHRGVRYVTMAHFTSNQFAVSSASRKKAVSFSWLSREFVRLANRIGMMIDLSHTHTEVIDEVARLSHAPVFVSHGAVSAVRRTFRNLNDEDIKNIARKGGVIGLIYANWWLRRSIRKPELDVVLDHADYIKNLVGSSHLALGSDWDGFISTPLGMRDASDLPKLTELFIKRGYSEDEIRGILGLNFMKMWEDVLSNAQ